MSTPDLENVDDRLNPEAILHAGTSRERQLGRIMLQSRQVSSLSVLYALAMSDHLGINLSDLMCLGALSSSGPVTAGQLAAMLGLSTGTVTGLVDRLERLNLVHRQRDEQDRRRIVIHLDPARAKEIGKAFVPMLKAGWQNLEQFSDDDLAVIERYFSASIATMREATREARERERRPILPPSRRGDPS